MKKLLIVLIWLFSIDFCQAQLFAYPDSFRFRNDIPMNYILFVLRNDSASSSKFKTITGFSKKGSNANKYNLSLSADKQYITITDTFSSSSYSDTILYYAQDSLGSFSDSDFVFFSKVNMIADMYPGDANNDSLVNHLDLLPIGLNFNLIGNPRHNLDTNISFVPRKVFDWSFSYGGINAKFSDLNGDGVVNYTDIDLLSINLGNSRGIYTPKLSDTALSLGNLTANLIQDTIDIIDSTLSVPLKLSGLNPLSSYGVGYTVGVKYLNKTSQTDEVYTKFDVTEKTNPWTDSSLRWSFKDKKSKLNHIGVSHTRLNRINGNMGGDVGVVEIIVEVILLGIVNKGDIGRFKIELSDLALIDNNASYISVKPISKYVYIRKSTAGVLHGNEDKIQVYPTLVADYTTIVNPTLSKPLTYSIYNALGHKVHKGVALQNKNTIETNHWPSGIYYLKLDNSSKVFKLMKL